MISKAYIILGHAGHSSELIKSLTTEETLDKIIAQIAYQHLVC